jgi:hypothetical protein
MRETYERMQPFFGTGRYVNYLDGDETVTRSPRHTGPTTGASSRSRQARPEEFLPHEPEHPAAGLRSSPHADLLPTRARSRICSAPAGNAHHGPMVLKSMCDPCCAARVGNWHALPRLRNCASSSGLRGTPAVPARCPARVPLTEADVCRVTPNLSCSPPPAMNH